jgi:hypothetical protein
MADFFAHGHAIDLILALVVVEAALLIRRRLVTGRGPPPAAILANLLSGTFLLLGLRSALVDAWWGWTALCLLAALAAHWADLYPRL